MSRPSSPGDEVYGFGHSAFAEYITVPQGRLPPKPRNLTFEQAAAVPLAAVTALQCLRAWRASASTSSSTRSAAPPGLPAPGLLAPGVIRSWQAGIAWRVRAGGVSLMAGPVAFVGREDELSRLLEALGGRARLVLVVGDAGVGKTRFADEAMTRAAAAEMMMVRGECLPLAETLPLLPVAAPRRQPVRTGEQTGRRLRRHGPGPRRL